jgi:hypothetical protein
MFVLPHWTQRDPRFRNLLSQKVSLISGHVSTSAVVVVSQPDAHLIFYPQSKTFGAMPPSLLPVVLAADNFPSHPLHDPYPLSHPQSRDIYTPFHLTFSDYQARLPPVGLLRPSVLAELQADSRDGSSCPWQFHSLARPGMGKREDDEGDELDLEVVCVFFADWVVKGGKRVMGRAMKEVVERWRDEGKFPEPLGGELLSYRSSHS